MGYRIDTVVIRDEDERNTFQFHDGRLVQQIHGKYSDEDEVVDEGPTPVVPELVSAEVPVDGNNQIFIYFDSTVNDTTVPNNSQFTATINSMPMQSVGNVLITLNYVILVFGSEELPFAGFAYGDIITVSYTQPLLNPLQSLSGGLVESFVDFEVTNNIEWPALAPSGLILSVEGDDIRLNWTDNDLYADGVSIERSTNGVDYAEIDTVVLGVETYLDETVIAGVHYYYQVRAFKNTDESDPSNPIDDLIDTMLTSDEQYYLTTSDEQYYLQLN